MELALAIAENVIILAGTVLLASVIAIKARSSQESLYRQVVLGLVFGIGAHLLLERPLFMVGDVYCDLSAGPLLAASLFAGPVGSAFALFIGLVARFQPETGIEPWQITGDVAIIVTGLLVARLTRIDGSVPRVVAQSAAIAVLAAAAMLMVQILARGIIIAAGFDAASASGWLVDIDHPHQLHSLVSLIAMTLTVLFLGLVRTRAMWKLSINHMIASSTAARAAADIGVWQYDFTHDRFSLDENSRKILHQESGMVAVSLSTFSGWLPPMDAERLLRAFANARQSGDALSETFHLVDGRGELRRLALHGDVQQTGGRWRSRAVASGVIIDQSPSAALQRELDLRSAALEAATCGILISDTSRVPTIVYANPAAGPITGYTPEELIGRPVNILIRGVEQQDEVNKISRAVENREACSAFVQNTRKDGTRYWNYLRVAPIADADGTVRHFVGIMVDVTERVNAQTEIRDTRDQLTAILQSAPNAILTVDAGGRIASFNRAAEQLFGWPEPEIAGRQIQELVPEEARGTHVKHAADYLANPDARTGIMSRNMRIVKARRRDGSTFPAMVSLGRFERNGKAMAAATALDMTEIVRANDELTTLSTDLSNQLQLAEQANRAKSQFLAHMSHELRTPLNAIIGYSELAQTIGVENLAPAKIDEYLGDILLSGRHLLNLINDLLDLSKIEQNVHKVALGPESATDILTDSLDISKPIASARAIDLAVTMPESMHVVCDRRALQQCLLNVIGNAIKYSSHGRTVEVDLHKDGAYAVFVVKDHGFGMKQEVLDKLGEPFVRSEDALIAGIEGTGLGLSITKRLIELQRGSIRFDSVVASGTRVEIRLPLTGAEQATHRQHAAD